MATAPAIIKCLRRSDVGSCFTVFSSRLTGAAVMDRASGDCNHTPGQLRVPNTAKHVCVAARIGEGKAPGEGNSHSIAKTSNAAFRRFWRQPFGLARVLAHGVVESPLLRMTKPQDFLLALSQNRDSASRVSLRYGLLIAPVDGAELVL